MPCSKCKIEDRVKNHSWCKSCRKIARRENYLINKDNDIERAKRWNKENREQYNANQREYLKRNSELHRERVKAWKDNNPERAKTLAYRSSANRRARLLDAYIETVDRIVVFKRDNGICGICGKDVDMSNFHVDHIVPLALGGDHSYSNVQVAHDICNKIKGAQAPGFE